MSDIQFPTAAPPSGALSLVDAQQRAAAISKGFRAAVRKANAPTVFVSGGGGFRARKGARYFFYGVIASFILLVLVPTVLVSVYYGLIASKQYATETRFSLQSGEGSVLDSLGGVVGIGTSQQAQDTQIIAAYIKSRAMLEIIDKAFDFKKLYGRIDVDYFSRLDTSNKIEDQQKYWEKRVDAKVEAQSGIITVEVRAFSAKESLAIANKIVEASEKLVNDLSARSRQDLLRQSSLELERAQLNLSKTSDDMRIARNAEGILDATATAAVSNKILTALRIELSSREQDFAVRAKTVTADAPQMRILSAQIANLKEQITKINNEVANEADLKPVQNGIDIAQGNSTPTKTLSSSMNALERKQVELLIAQQRYATAATAYESARLDVATQRAYLSPFLLPTLAEDAIYPKRWWNWTIFVLPDVIAWLLLLGISFMVRDYMV